MTAAGRSHDRTRSRSEQLLASTTVVGSAVVQASERSTLASIHSRFSIRLDPAACDRSVGLEGPGQNTPSLTTCRLPPAHDQRWSASAGLDATRSSVCGEGPANRVR